MSVGHGKPCRSLLAIYSWTTLSEFHSNQESFFTKDVDDVFVIGATEVYVQTTPENQTYLVNECRFR